MIGKVAWSVLVVFDKLINVVLLGHHSKTISMRLSFACYCQYVEPRYAWVPKLSKFIDWLCSPLEKEHIYNSYEAEEAHNPDLWKLYVVKDQIGLDLIVRDIRKLTHKGRIKR